MEIANKQVYLDFTDSHNGVLADEKLIVTIHNDGGGPFLGIRTESLCDTDSQALGLVLNEITLESEKHINELANALKKLLRDAIKIDETRT